MKFEESCIESHAVFDGKVLHVRCDRIRLPNGKESEREYVKHNGAVAVLPIDNDGKILMERQFRYANGRVFFEIPAGKLDSPDEVPKEAAKRELREETGAVADEMLYIGRYIPSPAVLTEKIDLYIAKGLHFGPTDFDEDENIEVVRCDLDDLFAAVMRGEIEDGKTQVAILKAHALREKTKGTDHRENHF